MKPAAKRTAGFSGRDAQSPVTAMGCITGSARAVLLIQEGYQRIGFQTAMFHGQSETPKAIRRNDLIG
ncbi:hypothetical protein N7489_005008 [Penicillium chrysogenum]|uniref:Uncharacterized protein n=1 Tax=Penicillium chrysogenum TaxID=5076 RepID=A0ABQ8WE96_PENCH|nr:uncharacterized protein N7489_005008 [Penicillium chrysogenum]KAJ5244912.1 hypothetical protein N7489_005008 [Penicillium chrysogenum]KAJ5264715.1 hypothetical protein N7505_007508 [Penicillium chrysogenum]KAJ5849199.1 hypothetical protein N7534_007888 [Penicillium rubens]